MATLNETADEGLLEAEDDALLSEDEEMDLVEEGALPPAGSLANVKIRRRRPKPTATGQQPAKPTASPAPVPVPDPGSSAPQQRDDMIGYWEEMRRGRPFAKSSDINLAKVAERWPGSLLLKIDPKSQRAELEKSFIMKLRTEQEKLGRRANGGALYAPMVLQWVLSLGSHVAKTGKPAQEQESFPLDGVDVSYNIWVVPLSDNQADVDHALCCLKQTVAKG